MLLPWHVFCGDSVKVLCKTIVFGISNPRGVHIMQEESHPDPCLARPLKTSHLQNISESSVSPLWVLCVSSENPLCVLGECSVSMSPLQILCESSVNPLPVTCQSSVNPLRSLCESFGLGEFSGVLYGSSVSPW